MSARLKCRPFLQNIHQKSHVNRIANIRFPCSSSSQCEHRGLRASVVMASHHHQERCLARIAVDPLSRRTI